MRSLAVSCFGLFLVVQATSDQVQAQTELFRFPTAQGVVVTPAPAVMPYTAPVVVTPGVAPATTAYRVPAATTIISAPVAPPVSYEAAGGYSSPTSVYYPPAEAPVAVDATYLPTAPAEVATEWTPVESPVTAYSPAYSPAYSADVPAVPQYASPTTTYRVPSATTPQVVYSSDWTSVAAPVIGSDPSIVTYPPTVTYSAYAAANAPATVPMTSATAMPVGPQVTVRPKVYIQGQPIRNMFRAITP